MNQKICLNMIVRNEAHVILETLEAVSPLLDYWVIVDTGSDDGTPEIIEEFFARKGISGEIHFRKWVNFGVNRSQALELCEGKAEYAWVIDADDILVGKPDFSRLKEDSYSLYYGPDFCYWRKQLFKTSKQWLYLGAIHEYPTCTVEATHARLEGDYHIESRRLGSRNLDPKKYERDIAILKDELKKTPDDPRSTFYLAQSYFDNSDYTQALHWYLKRATLKGWDEEVFYSKLRVAMCLEKIGKSFAEISQAYLDSWEIRPSRAEPLYQLSRLCRETERYQAGYVYASAGLEIAFPEQDNLFVDATVYDWRMADELSIHAYYTGRMEQSAKLCRHLLAKDSLPLDQVERVNKNLGFSRQKGSGKAHGAVIETVTSKPGATPAELLSPERLTSVVDIGANPIDGAAPYEQMLNQKLCTVTGFEPQESALQELNRKKGPLETYLPYAISDGHAHTLHVCHAPGMSSLLKPDEQKLKVFNLFSDFGKVESTHKVETRQLDSVKEIEVLDFLKLDIQGSELAVFKAGRETLKSCVAIQTEVSFFPLYKDQPLFAEVDAELRHQGFVLHTFAAVKKWPLSPYGQDQNPRQALNQLLEADAVYVKNFINEDDLSDEQLKHLCLVMHHCYGSFDLALRCIRQLMSRKAIPQSVEKEYLLML